MSKKRITISIDSDLLGEIDDKKGLISRSAIICDVLIKSMEKWVYSIINRTKIK